MQWGSPNQNSVLEMNDTLFSKRCSHEHETAWEGDDIIAPKGHFRRTAAHDVVGFLSVLQGIPISLSLSLPIDVRYAVLRLRRVIVPAVTALPLKRALGVG